MRDLLDLVPADFQLRLWGYILTDRRSARESLTRLNEADISEGRPWVVAGYKINDLSERYWDRTAAHLRTMTLNGGPVPESWALAGWRMGPLSGSNAEPA